MSGINYAVFVAAILVVIRWYIQNEGVGPDSDGSKGLLAMRTPANRKTGNAPESRRPVDRHFRPK